MKKNLISLFLGLMAIWSCTENQIVPDPSGHNEGAEVEVSRIEIVDSEDHLTRATYEWETAGGLYTMKYFWEKGDLLSIFSDADVFDPSIGPTVTAMRYELYRADGGKGYFHCNDFQFNPKYNYYALMPYRGEIESKKAIKLTYAGQRVKTNKDVSGLSKFDFQAGYAPVGDENTCKFQMKRLGAFLRVRMQMPSDMETKTFDKFEIKCSDATPIECNYTLDLTDNMSGLTDYAPSLEVDKTDDYRPKTLVVDLGEADPSGKNTGIELKGGEILTMYLCFPATDEYKNKTLIGTLSAKDSDTEKYTITMRGQKFVQNTAYSYGSVATMAGTISLNVSINKGWKLGTTETRALGDPGKADQLKRPDHLYVYTYWDGTLHDKQEINPTNDDDWDETSSMWTYRKAVTISYPTSPAPSEIRSYLIASYNEITTDPASLTQGATTDLTTMTYSSADQQFLKNLYAYYYDIDAAAPSLNAILYHVAAKLDVQWNAPAGLTGSNVSVTGLPTSGLKLFAPTGNDGPGMGSFTVPINEGNKYNGRAVFYVPQLASNTYRVILGTPSAEQTDDDILFSNTSTENRWTTWFKANITR